MRVLTVVHLLALVSASASVEYAESGSLSLLQTAAEVKGHNHVSVKWEPGMPNMVVVPKCGDGPLDGWLPGDGNQVGELNLGRSATTKEACIELVLKDPRCQDKQAAIDEWNLKEPGHPQTLSATYSPDHNICFCEWGVLDTADHPMMPGGYMTCLARGKVKVPKEKKDKTCKPSKATRDEIKAAKKAFKDLKAQMKAARKALKDAKAKGKAETEDCPDGAASAVKEAVMPEGCGAGATNGQVMPASSGPGKCKAGAWAQGDCKQEGKEVRIDSATDQTNTPEECVALAKREKNGKCAGANGVSFNDPRTPTTQGGRACFCEWECAGFTCNLWGAAHAGFISCML